MLLPWRLPKPAASFAVLPSDLCSGDRAAVGLIAGIELLFYRLGDPIDDKLV
jgi:hypothetical protein